MVRTGKCDSCIGLLENIKHMEQVIAAEDETIKKPEKCFVKCEEPDTSGLVHVEDNDNDIDDNWMEPSDSIYEEKPLVIHFTKKVELDEKLKQQHQSKIKSESEKVVRRCEYCRKKYRNRKFHLKNHHFDKFIEEFHDEDKKVYYCSEEGCEKKFLAEGKLLSHLIKVHNEPETIKQSRHKSKCPFCDEVFEKETWRLMRHVKVMHFTEEDTEVYKEFMQANPPKLCPQCGAAYHNERGLKHHMRYCNKPNKSVECQICGKSLKESYLQTHMLRRHTENSETFVCPICGKFFKNRLLLDYHSMHCIEPGKSRKEYKCPECGKTFLRFSYMAKHVKFSHRNERNHACDKCGKTFQEVHDLREHIVAIHDKLKPFICDLCGFKTAKHGNLNIHRQKSHSKPHLSLTAMWQMILRGEHPYIDTSYEFLHLIKPKNADRL